MTKKQLLEADYENARRGQSQQIRKAWERGSKDPKKNKEEAEVTADEDIEMQDDDGIEDKDFNAIVKFLAKNRRKLALNTMHFRMGEHVLLAHIVACGLNVDPNVFRAFLKRCQADNKYFK